MTLNLILMLNTMKVLMKKILNLKLVTVSEYQNTKKFLLRDILSIGQKKFLSLLKLKIQSRGPMLLVTWMVNLLLEVFMENNCKKLAKENSELQKYLKEKVINCSSNGKDMTIHLIVGLIKRTFNEIPSYKNESILS